MTEQFSGATEMPPRHDREYPQEQRAIGLVERTLGKEIGDPTTPEYVAVRHFRDGLRIGSMITFVEEHKTGDAATDALMGSQVESMRTELDRRIAKRRATDGTFGTDYATAYDKLVGEQDVLLKGVIAGYAEGDTVPDDSRLVLSNLLTNALVDHRSEKPKE